MNTNLPHEPLNPKPIFHHVQGSPYQPRDLVRIVKNIDPDVCDLRKYVGSTGRVLYLEYNCGCGQHYPDDPMIGIRLDESLEVIEFWKDELEKIQIT